MKLHEMLAVGTSLDTQAEKTTKDLTTTFQKKEHLFEEKRTVFQSNVEGAPAVTETQSDIQTTVLKELKWLAGFVIKATDMSHAINVANTTAKADVKIGTRTLLKDVPAQSLLELEKILQGYHNVIAAVPTLDPAKGYRPDENRGAGYYVARPVEKIRRIKVKKVIRLAEATPEHAEQAQLVDMDEPGGVISEQEWSAKLTPADKAMLLDRCEMLIRAVKSARSRANDHEVKELPKIGRTLIDFILDGSEAVE